MKISLTAKPVGANIYSAQSALIYSVDVHPHGGGRGAGLEPAFSSALFEQLPTLQSRIGELPRSWIQDRASLAHLFMLSAVELQNTLGCEIERGEVRPTSSAGIYDVIFGYENSSTGSAAGSVAEALIQHLLPEGESSKEDARPTFDFATALERFIQRHQSRVLSLEHRYVVNAARERGIPAEYLGNGLVLFGQGRFQMRRLKHFSDRTSHIAYVLSSDKQTTNHILSEIGLPVPEQQFVGSGDGAVETAEVMGYPVVVKPLDSDFGRGVSVDLNDAKGVRDAYKRARHYRRGVIVETVIPGSDHRLLVIDGELVAAAKRIPAHVTGDGAKTVKELVENVNRDPKRGAKGLNWLLRLEFDEETNRILAEAGYTHEAIPGAGEIVYLRSVSNLSAGGTSKDVTDQVHPDNRRMAIWAAAAIGIDVAGIDYITTDISRSYKEVGGGICEINTTPALSPHVAADGAQRDVAGPIIDALYPPGTPSRILTAVITGNTGRTATARMLAHVLTHAGHVVGLSTTDGVFIGGEQIGSSYVSDQSLTRMIFRNPTVDAAVFEISPHDLMRSGLGFDSCDVAAVLNAADRLSAVDWDRRPHIFLTATNETPPIGEPDRNIVDLDGLGEAMGVVVKAARNISVINADDELCPGLADHAAADDVVLLGRKANPILEFDPLAGLRTDISEDKKRSALFAASMAHSLGRTEEEICEGLNSFDFDTL